MPYPLHAASCITGQGQLHAPQQRTQNTTHALASSLSTCQSSLLQNINTCSLQQAVAALRCPPPCCATHWACNSTQCRSLTLCCRPQTHAAGSLLHSYRQGLLHAAHHDRAQGAVAHRRDGLPHGDWALPVLAPHQVELCSGPGGRVISLVAVVSVHLRQTWGYVKGSDKKMLTERLQQLEMGLKGSSHHAQLQTSSPDSYCQQHMCRCNAGAACTQEQMRWVAEDGCGGCCPFKH